MQVAIFKGFAVFEVLSTEVRKTLNLTLPVLICQDIILYIQRANLIMCTFSPRKELKGSLMKMI
jgi:hypothetical protein